MEQSTRRERDTYVTRDDSPRRNAGASRSSPTEHTRRGSFTKAPSEPTVIQSSRRLVALEILRYRLVRDS